MEMRLLVVNERRKQYFIFRDLSNPLQVISRWAAYFGREELALGSEIEENSEKVLGYMAA